MEATPLVVLLHDRLAPRAPGASADGVDAAHDLAEDGLIIGFGRVGQVVSQPLLARRYRIAIIDNDVAMIEAAGAFGFKAHYGPGQGRAGRRAKASPLPALAKNERLLLVSRSCRRWLVGLTAPPRLPIPP